MKLLLLLYIYKEIEIYIYIRFVHVKTNPRRLITSACTIACAITR
jgi:hypothetical protein